MAGLYELVPVARQPVSGATHTFTELDAITFTQLTWSEDLNGAGAVQFSCKADKLASVVKSRFLALDANPTEVWVRRDGTLVAAGIVLGGQIQEGTLTISAPGLLAYLAFMLVDADLTYSAVDQFTIGKGLVDQWQALAYGNFGIVTSGVGTSGVVRTRSYLFAERHQVLQRLLELGQVDNGFDVHINPSTRALVLSYPQKGADLSASVFLDTRNIFDSAVSFSIAPGDLASDALGVGTASGAAAITAKKANTTLRAAWGRAGVSATFDGVSDSTTLDGHTQALLDARDAALIMPGTGLLPVSGADVGDFTTGDTVTYDFDAGLGRQTGAYRVARKQVTVNEAGAESIAVQFV